jgi:Tripartite tricarboxylate transporter TctB family
MVARLTALACIALGGFLYWAALGSDHPLAYLFPRVLALIMVALGAGMLALELSSKRQAREAVKADIRWARLWPGIVMLILYMAIAQSGGFYVSSWLAFVALAIWYAPGEQKLVAVRRCVPISLAFMAVLYLLFWTLLRVQVPRGLAF